MTWIIANRIEWFQQHADRYGGLWLQVENYPASMKPIENEAGALIKPDGTVIHRIKRP